MCVREGEPTAFRVCVYVRCVCPIFNTAMEQTEAGVLVDVEQAQTDASPGTLNGVLIV